MTWRSESIPPVPETTAAMVKAAFPKGNLYVDLHTEFGALYDDDPFADLYSKNRGRRIEIAPWRLALVTVMQYNGRAQRSPGGRCGAPLYGLEICPES
jgi:transposase